MVVTQVLQSYGADSFECRQFTDEEVHAFFLSNQIYSFDESLIFSLAVEMLEERHRWSYSGTKFTEQGEING